MAFKLDPSEAHVLELEKNYKENRESIFERTERGNMINTPLVCLRKLARAYNIILAFSNNCINEKKGRNRQLWVCIITVGLWEGIGRAPVEQVAKELAAADILNRLKYSDSKDQVEPYGLIPGFRICPSVMTQLMNLCREKMLPKPHFTCDPFSNINGKSDGTFFFNMNCRVGNEYITKGSSDDERIAKFWAAKKMFEAIDKKRTFPYMNIKIGKDALMGLVGAIIPIELPRHTPRIKNMLDKEKNRTGMEESLIKQQVVDFESDEEEEEDEDGMEWNKNNRKINLAKINKLKALNFQNLLNMTKVKPKGENLLKAPPPVPKLLPIKRSLSDNEDDCDAASRGMATSKACIVKKPLKRFYAPSALTLTRTFGTNPKPKPNPIKNATFVLDVKPSMPIREKPLLKVIEGNPFSVTEKM